MAYPPIIGKPAAPGLPPPYYPPKKGKPAAPGLPPSPFKPPTPEALGAVIPSEPGAPSFEEAKQTEGLTADGSALYYLLMGFGWTPQQAYSFAYRFDMGDIPTQVVDDTLKSLEQKFETQQVEQQLEGINLKEAARKRYGVTLSFYPVESIRQELLKPENLTSDVIKSVTSAQGDPIYGGRYGTTLEDWAKQRAQEIHYGFNPAQGGLLASAPDIQAFEARLGLLQVSGTITPDEYAQALLLRSYGNIPIIKGGSTEQQKINASEYFLKFGQIPPLPQGESYEDYLLTVPEEPFINLAAIPPGGFVERTPTQKAWEKLVKKSEQTPERVIGF